MKATTRIIAASVFTAIVLAACAAPPRAAAPAAQPAQPTRDVGITVGYAAPGLVGGQRDIQNSFQQAATAKGWNVVTTNSNGDPAKQNQQIENLIALGVKAIVAVPDDSQGICAAVEAAKKAGIPFYTIDRSPIGCKINMTVLSDNYLAGQQSAEELVKLLSAKYGSPRGKVLEITGNLAQNVAQLRGGGFNDVMKKYPDITVITKEGNWDAAKGQGIVRDVLSSDPDVDAIYVHSDAVYFPGTIAVLRELGKLKKRSEEGHIFLAGVDGSKAGVQAIKDGWADQVSNQPVPDFGIVTDYIEKELKGEKIEFGRVVKEGALWSPAEIKDSDVGPQLFLSTTSVTEANMDHPGLWGNQ